VIAVLDYGIGNLASAHKALVHLGADAELVTDPDRVGDAEGVVLPGVGAFGACANALRSSGLDKPALEAIEHDVPFLAICVGLQLLYASSVESPGVAGLGVFDGEIAELDDSVKRPQMQWNQLEAVAPSAALQGIETRPWFYFVHSFSAPVGPETVAVCQYPGPVNALIERDRLWGSQFHPEKSGPSGLALLANFVRLVEAA
jgi:glutamine amidotransferase